MDSKEKLLFCGAVLILLENSTWYDILHLSEFNCCMFKPLYHYQFVFYGAVDWFNTIH